MEMTEQMSANMAGVIRESAIVALLEDYGRFLLKHQKGVVQRSVRCSALRWTAVMRHRTRWLTSIVG